MASRTTALQKLETRIKNLVIDQRFRKVSNKLKYSSKTLFEYNSNSIKYGYYRCYITQANPIVEEDFKVTIILNNENFPLLSSNISNPPKSTYAIVNLFNKVFDTKFDELVVGHQEDKIVRQKIFITKELYEIISKINREESKDKVVRFYNRALPFLANKYNAPQEQAIAEKDYSLLLKELIASGTLNQEDIIFLSQNLDVGNNADVIIKQQVHKQVEWLIDSIQTIIDEPRLTIPRAKFLGNKYFGFYKSDINGPEHLMELILTKYGQYTIFGAPVLLNTDKYVVNTLGLPRCQFDILLINHLSDLEVVELKRPDIAILDYDTGRNKFFASKELSVAISQAERYISAVYRDNDDEYKINNQKIREYINSQIGGTMTVEVSRPTALIVIGSDQSIVEPYDNLSEAIKKKVTKENYSQNSRLAYKELKGAYKNINITSYSELIESARTRMIINKQENIDEIEVKSEVG